MEKQVRKIKHLSFDVSSGFFEVVLEGYYHEYIFFIRSKNLHPGHGFHPRYGVNQSISRLMIGGKIQFPSSPVCEAVREIKDATIVADLMSEIDPESGRFVKW